MDKARWSEPRLTDGWWWYRARRANCPPWVIGGYRCWDAFNQVISEVSLSAQMGIIDGGDRQMIVFDEAGETDGVGDGERRGETPEKPGRGWARVGSLTRA